MIVPNKFPIHDSAYRIALIGEAPGEDEVKQGQPFVGASGRFLSALLARAGTSKEACFLGNVCQHKPDYNEIATFNWEGPEIQSGLAQLTEDLATFKPNIIVALGGAPLHFLKCGTFYSPKKRKQQNRLVFNWPHKPTVWRGSLFSSPIPAPLNGVKCLATVHPAYVLRDYEMCPLLQFDLKRAVNEATTPKLELPERHFSLEPEKVIENLNYVKWSKVPVSIDIEGGINSMSCISFAISKNSAFIVPFFDKALNRYYDLATECKIFRLMADVLEDPEIPKILQNSLYDRFVLQYCYKIRVSNVHDDTMLKHWEYYCELPKSLDTQASIYTKEPYYKGDRKTQDDKTFFEYCCRDSAVTYEINSVLTPRIGGTSLEHYRLNMRLLQPLLYMELRGIRYDYYGAQCRRADVRGKMFEEQARLNGLTSHYVKSKDDLFRSARENLAYKKPFIAHGDYQGIADNAYKDSKEDASRLAWLVKQPLTLAVLGEIEDLSGISLNISSPKRVVDFLYRVMELPMQYNVKRKSGDEEDERSPTGDYEALLTLTKWCLEHDQKFKARILTHAIEIRSLATRERMLSIHADKDGRIRTGYNIVGSETGRISSYESPTGSGYNLQTIPKYDRDLFMADEGFWMFQCDLSGADGWTVAAYCAMLGDRTMLDDYLYGLKPAKILTLALHGVGVDFGNREALREACKKVDPDDWDYFAMKRLQHGCSYVEGPKRVSNQIFTDSEGKFYLSESDCRRLRDQFFFKRYPGIPALHRWMDSKIRERPTIISASGHVRHFFGRKEDLLPKAMAHEPQMNTTYANNLALFRLWTDPDNRLDKDRLRVEPLHTVHDAIVGQFKKEDTSWAVVKIREWFNNQLNIAGQKITIPFEGGYGESWGKLKEGVI